ncbi:FGGY carbohydrate kinase domain-containing protein isoform X2 [Xenopus laevis]|uniref:FGGY carbohydrate kinase domain-containing protein n=1 Tax=Xenopus laevis TaxID=8355 RepID=A0A8J1MU46_XENLA|nr:FGGY carbohydrate kinase domain-containing protein isoform X2 [Xenopus laevis]
MQSLDTLKLHFQHSYTHRMQQQKGEEVYYVGIDVGTASVRVALVDQFGTVVDQVEQSIKIWEPQPDHYEQSSDDIWAACCQVTKQVVRTKDPRCIRGLGFDATCSLVVLDTQFQPLAVNSQGEHKRNIIMWMDHRAGCQVDRINRTNHKVLRYVGGVMSVEMQPPKLLWLKENLREECWNKSGQLFDLPDFLTWKATGDNTRSFCTLVCKWTYSLDHGWDDSFWKEIGLEDICEGNYVKIGNQVMSPGASIGNCLTATAAKELGLPEGLPVAASLIDAHAGGLGVIGASLKEYGLEGEHHPITSRLALICGTSSCHMGVVGLTLSKSLDDLATLYLATIQAIALGTRHILETMQTAGHHISTLHLCGGLSKNPLFVQMHADITGLPVVLSKEVESVLVGAAILGACASGDFPSIKEAMEKMSKVGKIIFPNHEDKRFYDKKYEVFLKLSSHQKEYQAIMGRM